MCSTEDYLARKIVGRRNGILYLPHHLLIKATFNFMRDCERRNITIEVVDKYDVRSCSFVQIQQDSKCNKS